MATNEVDRYQQLVSNHDGKSQDWTEPTSLGREFVGFSELTGFIESIPRHSNVRPETGHNFAAADHSKVLYSRGNKEEDTFWEDMNTFPTVVRGRKLTQGGTGDSTSHSTQTLDEALKLREKCCLW